MAHDSVGATSSLTLIPLNREKIIQMSQSREPFNLSDEAPEPIGVPVPRDVAEALNPQISPEELTIVAQCVNRLSILWGNRRDGKNRLRDIVNSTQFIELP